MSKLVINSVSANTNIIGAVTSVSSSTTYVADSTDIADAKKELNGTINEIKQILEKKIVSTNNRIDHLDGLPDDIRKVIETTNNQQVLMLRNVYRELSENLAKQQKILNDSCTKAATHVQQLSKEHQHAESLYSRIQLYGNSLSSLRGNISSLKGRVTWLFILLILCIIIILGMIITFCVR